MLGVFLPIFAADTKVIYGYTFVAPLNKIKMNYIFFFTQFFLSDKNFS